MTVPPGVVFQIVVAGGDLFWGHDVPPCLAVSYLPDRGGTNVVNLGHLLIGGPDTGSDTARTRLG